MTYPNIRHIADHIEKVHQTFAERPSSEALNVLTEMVDYMTENTAVVGFSFLAKSREQYASLDVLIEINQTPEGWDVRETIKGGM